MYSKKSNHIKSKTNQVPKIEKPKPQWTTDFTDYDKYKLSQAEMIQKKAALQSKHREQAKNLLQQRRRKLQMGIIDEQTKKVFQTALLSKNIDINPPIRKNLTQMIQYQREQQQNMIKANQQQSDQDYQSDKEQQNCQYKVQKDLKQAQDFIRKFQRAKKQHKIQRAMEIILQDVNKNNNQQNKKSTRQSKVSPMTNNYLNSKQCQSEQKKSIKSNKFKQNSTSNQDALSSIQDTIRFMQEKLFAAKKSVNQSFVSKPNDSYESFNKFQGQNDFRLFQDAENKFNYEQKQDQNFLQNFGELSHLKINLRNEENSDEDQCMDTIRRMRQMIDSKDDFYSAPDFKKQKENRRDDNYETTEKRMKLSPSLGFTSTIQKNSHNYMQSEAEVDFSLTSNNDEPNQVQQKQKKQYFAPSSNLDVEYEKLKQNLFSQMGYNQCERPFSRNHKIYHDQQHSSKYKVANILQNQEDQNEQPSFAQKQYKQKFFQTQILKEQQQNEDNLSNSNLSKVSKIKKSKRNKSNKISQEVEAMKNMIQSMKVNIETTKVQPLKIDHKDGMIGFDFRGSINIKKNIIAK